jgi:nucleolar MIF4G domain-containing protein 1
LTEPLAPRRRPGLPPNSAMRSRPSGPTGLQLPQSLLDQLNETSGDRNTYLQPILLNITLLDATPTSRHGRGSLHKPKISRKEARKQSREGKKQRKAEYFSSTGGTSSKRLATSPSPHPDSPPLKKRTIAGQPWLQSSGLQSEKGLPENSSRLTSKETRAVTSSRTPSSRPVTLPRSQQEEDEDRYIALLENKLTSGKRSKNGPGYLKDIMDDGLGGG